MSSCRRTALIMCTTRWSIFLPQDREDTFTRILGRNMWSLYNAPPVVILRISELTAVDNLLHTAVNQISIGSYYETGGGGMEVGNVVISWVGHARLLCIAFNLQIDFQYQSVLSKPDTSSLPAPLSVNTELSVVLLVHVYVRMKTVILQLDGSRGGGALPFTARLNLAYYALHMSCGKRTHIRKDVWVPSYVSSSKILNVIRSNLVMVFTTKLYCLFYTGG
jgi:hypothetical protein